MPKTIDELTSKAAKAEEGAESDEGDEAKLEKIRELLMELLEDKKGETEAESAPEGDDKPLGAPQPDTEEAGQKGPNVGAAKAASSAKGGNKDGYGGKGGPGRDAAEKSEGHESSLTAFGAGDTKPAAMKGDDTGSGDKDMDSPSKNSNETYSDRSGAPANSETKEYSGKGGGMSYEGKGGPGQVLQQIKKQKSDLKGELPDTPGGERTMQKIMSSKSDRASRNKARNERMQEMQQQQNEQLQQIIADSVDYAMSRLGQSVKGAGQVAEGVAEAASGPAGRVAEAVTPGQTVTPMKNIRQGADNIAGQGQPLATGDEQEKLTKLLSQYIK